ncbi:MAG: tRNA 2-thiouridine(34) synthase MnmA [Rhodomicrobium sp.]
MLTVNAGAVWEANPAAEPSLTPASLGLKGSASGHRIVVAMSGGVDSSLAAALVARAGYETVGITLQLYDHGAAIARKGACCAGQDIMDARRVADALGIPHYVLNYESRFHEAVIEDFASSYLAGETPVPCIRCNQSVKFSDLLRTARELGASALVTGHYVRSRQGPAGWEMFQALSAGRDQSYFLFATTQEQLDFLRFPLGSLQKSETRALAASLGLPVAAKPDSQDICFAPTGDYAGVIRKLRPESAEPGEVVHADGTVLGTHPGIVNFTVGQRKGLGIAVGEPLFVIRIEPGLRRVIVGPRELLRAARLGLRDVNWIGPGTLGEAASEQRPLSVKVRSTQEPRPARLVSDAGQIMVELAGVEFGVAAGQACVFYEDGGGAARVLGGGFIASANR